MSSQIIEAAQVTAPASSFVVVESSSLVPALRYWPPLAAFGSEGQERITVELIAVLHAWLSRSSGSPRVRRDR